MASQQSSSNTVAPFNIRSMPAELRVRLRVLAAEANITMEEFAIRCIQDSCNKKINPDVAR